MSAVNNFDKQPLAAGSSVKKGCRAGVETGSV